MIPASKLGMPFLIPAPLMPAASPAGVLGEAALPSVHPHSPQPGHSWPQPSPAPGLVCGNPPPHAPAVPSLCVWGGCPCWGGSDPCFLACVFNWPYDPPHTQGSSSPVQNHGDALRQCPSFLRPRGAYPISRCPHSHGTQSPSCSGMNRVPRASAIEAPGLQCCPR